VAAARERVLITGILGCLGAWVTRSLLAEGAVVVGYDLGGSTHRLDLVVPSEWRDEVKLLNGDITDAGAFGEALDRNDITRVIHLAALQVPFCRADPVTGGQVNVVGTAIVFEAVKERLERIPGVVYASSVAVYGSRDSGAIGEDPHPETLYGVYKLANEGTARVYWEEHGVPSAGLRPYAVYGLGRDQGLTSGPTQAMAAAARGAGFRIGFGGEVQHDFAPDVANALIGLSRGLETQIGATADNMPGTPRHMEDLVAAIESSAPAVEGMVSFEDVPLPFPAAPESSLDVITTSLEQGVAETIEAFRRATNTVNV
jgi:nucleoside-diphosphate-sugar epimerase